MQLSDQVCSLENAKRLKELSIAQNSLLYFREVGLTQDRWIIDYCEKPMDEFKDRWCSAFTASELLELLPYKTKNGYLTMHRSSRYGWWVYYTYKDSEINKDDAYCYCNTSLPDALCLLLIKLLENGLHKIGETT